MPSAPPRVAVGHTLTNRSFDLGWVHRLPRGRGVQLTQQGRGGPEETLGVSV